MLHVHIIVRIGAVCQVKREPPTRRRTHARGSGHDPRLLLPGLRPPKAKIKAWLAKVGFGDPVFRPFTLPIDLPKATDAADLTTYTVTAADGRRLPFRGTLFQPWCHLTARKR